MAWFMKAGRSGNSLVQVDLAWFLKLAPDHAESASCHGTIVTRSMNHPQTIWHGVPVPGRIRLAGGASVRGNRESILPTVHTQVGLHEIGAIQHADHGSRYEKRRIGHVAVALHES